MTDSANAHKAQPKAPHVFVPPAAPRTTKAAGTRKLLLRVATAEFISRGYSAVSMQDIAAAANLTKGALYGHFRSKGQLLVEVIRTKLAEADAAVDYADPDNHRGVALMHDEVGRDARLLQVDAAAVARHDPDVAAGLREMYAERRLHIQEAMDPSDDPAAAAVIIAALTLGIGVHEAASIPLVDDARLDSAIAGVIRGLGLTHPAPNRIANLSKPNPNKPNPNERGSGR
jgi:AcrR family transcriptional regulator